MALIPWLVLLGRSLMFKTLHSMSIVNSPTKKGCTDLMQRIGVVSQLFWQCRARENYGKLLKSLCEEEIAKLLPQKRSKKIQKSTHGWQNHGLFKSLRLVKFCAFPNLIDNLVNNKIWLFLGVVETIVGYLELPVVLWVFFIVFSIFCIMSFGDCTKKHPKIWINMRCNFTWICCYRQTNTLVSQQSNERKLP